MTRTVIQSLVDDTFTYCDWLFFKVKHKLALCVMSDANILSALFGFKFSTVMRIHSICAFASYLHFYVVDA